MVKVFVSQRRNRDKRVESPARGSRETEVQIPREGWPRRSVLL